MKKFYLLILLAIFMYIAACIAPQENSTEPQDLDLHRVNFTLFDQNQLPISEASVNAVFDASKYDKNNSQISNAPQNQTYETNKQGIAGEFVMHGSIEYNITAKLPDGTIYSINLTPIDFDYNWTITPTPKPTPSPEKTWGGGRVYTPEEIAGGLQKIIDTIF